MFREQIAESEVFVYNSGGRVVIEGFTNRLIIRSYSGEDFNECLALYGDKEITKYFDHGKPRIGNEIFEYVQSRGSKYFENGEPFGLFSVFLRDNNCCIGQVDLVPTEIPGEVEIGWIFHKKFHNKGFCSETVLEFLIPLIYKLSDLGYKANGNQIYRIIATAHPENIASNKIIKKAGFTLYQAQLRYGGKPRNCYYIQIKNEQQE